MSVYSIVSKEFFENSTKICNLGEGTFGTVDLFNTPDGKQVVKRTKLQEKSLGYPPDFLNEVDLLIKLGPVDSVVNMTNFCLDETKKRGYIMLEHLDTNLTEWATKTRFQDRMESLEKLISEIGGALAYMHRFSLLHNDIKTNNILVKIQTNGIQFKLADFGKSYLVIHEEYSYGAIARHLPPDDRDLFASELWGFMICLLEVIIGGKKLFKASTASDFYSNYCSFTRRGYYRFDIPRFLRTHLTNQEIKKIPTCFWRYIEPIVKNSDLNAEEILERIGVTLDPVKLEELESRLSKTLSRADSYAAIENYSKRRFISLSMEERYSQFYRMMNRFLQLSPSLASDDILRYVEVAMVIVGKRKIKKLNRFKEQETFLLYQRQFLEVLDYQIHITKKHK